MISLNAPASYLWVQSGAAAGDGSFARPFATMSAAVAFAAPGTAVMVKAGVYNEAVKIPSRSGGTDEAPIWLVSCDGQFAARIVVPAGGQAGIEGLGVSNYGVVGFHIIGGAKAGIQFSQSGSDFSHMCRNILIQGNRCVASSEDGIKISQADNVSALDNVVSGCGQQGIDFLNVWGGRIFRNDVADVHVSSGIFAKGGSRDIEIAGNWVHDISAYPVAGITAGGFVDPQYVRPGSPLCEADGMTIRNNRVERVRHYALQCLGARNVVATENDLESLTDASPGKTSSWQIIGIGPDNNGVVSSDVSITGNTLVGTKAEWGWGKPQQDPARDRLDVSGNVRGAASLVEGPAPFDLWRLAGLSTRWAA